MGKHKDETGKTRVGKFLSDIGPAAKGILNVAGNLTGIDALNAVAGAIKTSSDLDAEQKAEALKRLELDLQDVQDAREMNSRAQESANASWLSKNVVSIIALLVVAATIATFFMTLEPTITQGIFQLCTIILSYYFGATARENIFNHKS